MSKIQGFFPKNLSNQLKKLKFATYKLQNCLPTTFSSHCQVTQYNDRSVTIHVSSSHVIHALRFHTNDIKKALECEHVHFVLDLFIPKINEASSLLKAKSLSNATKQSLANTAQYTNNPALKAALEKLSKS